MCDSLFLKDVVGGEHFAVLTSMLKWPYVIFNVCFTAALKDKGNEAFAQEDYETAAKYYSDGLAELRDMQPLYTNRAQVNVFSMGV